MGSVPERRQRFSERTYRQWKDLFSDDAAGDGFYAATSDGAVSEDGGLAGDLDHSDPRLVEGN